MSRTDAYWAALEKRDADRWERIKAMMLAKGFDVDKGACLYLPTHFIAGNPPDWVFMNNAIPQALMSRTRPGTAA